MREKHYVLDGHKAVASDLMTWARWLDTAREERVVARTETPNGEVSTVFIGLDHNFDPAGPPHIFETMVFGGTNDGDQDRYSTWDEAEAGHAAIVERVLAVWRCGFGDVELSASEVTT